MKTIFFSLIAIVLFSSDSFSQTKDSSSISERKGWWCRVFTVELSVGFASIATDVTICVQHNGFGGWNAAIEKSGAASIPGYIKVSELITKSSGKISSKDIESVIVKSKPEDIESLKWSVKSSKNKVVNIDNESYLEVVLEVTK